MSASQLKANRVVDVYALVTSTPSFNITQDSAVSQQLNIRGVGTTEADVPFRIAVRRVSCSWQRR